MTHTDIPDNDFTELFRTLSDDPDSYRRRTRRRSPPRSVALLHSQILPSNSVNLAWSAWSIQWLSRAPMPVPDHLPAAHSHDGEVRAAYERQAAQLARSSSLRGRELSPGGLAQWS